jgi:N-acetylglucosamine-6-sulfatase
MADTDANYAAKPRWLKNQRNSRHGVDFGYNLPDFDVRAYYRRYCEALLAVDDSVGRIIDFLASAGQLESTLLVYMGDNGFQFGDHGLIDKRVAYEASIRVPLIFHCPEILPPGTVVGRTVANIDVAPTLLDVAGAGVPEGMDGRSFLRLAMGEAGAPWRETTLYEYYWEQNYPQTPTMHAVVGDRFKYVRYHGIWDSNELYDLVSDPDETTNLWRDTAHRERVARMNQGLFDLLGKTGGDQVPLLRDRGFRFPWRNPDKAPQAPFPDWMMVDREPPRE